MSPSQTYEQVQHALAVAKWKRKHNAPVQSGLLHGRVAVQKPMEIDSGNGTIFGRALRSRSEPPSVLSTRIPIKRRGKAPTRPVRGEAGTEADNLEYRSPLDPIAYPIMGLPKHPRVKSRELLLAEKRAKIVSAVALQRAAQKLNEQVPGMVELSDTVTNGEITSSGGQDNSGDNPGENTKPMCVQDIQNKRQ